MTPTSIRADYRASMLRVGEAISLRRYTDPAARTFVDYATFARPMNYRPNELVGAIQQGDINLIVLAQDLETAGFPFPVRKGDKAIVGGKEFNIEAPDNNSRRVKGVICAYELRVRG